MMSDRSSDNVRNLETRVTEAGEAIGERVRSATAATAAAAGVADDVVDAGRRASQSVSRQIDEKPLMAVLVGFALGYVASLWIHGRGRSGKIADDKASAKAPLP
jgi:hypothetical protein